MTLITEYDPPGNMTMYYLSTFADIGKALIDASKKDRFICRLDADGIVEHILPVCLQSDCSISQIYVRDNDQVRFPIKRVILVCEERR